TGNIHPTTKTTPWPTTGRPRRAAISAFGISGTNAHLILEQAPHTTTENSTTASADAAPVWVLSGRTPAALRAQAVKLAGHLDRHPDLHPGDVAHALLTNRTHHSHRAAIVAADPGAFRQALADLAEARSNPDVITAEAVEAPGDPVFAFGGQGAQWAGMGRGLYGVHPVFTAALDETCAELDRHLDGVALLDVIRDRPEALQDTTYTQPALFAVQTALFRTLRHHGIAPARLVGHSIGELTAAHAAGILSLSDAARLVATRARLMGSAPAGAMASIELPAEDVAAIAERYGVVIAAVNSPTATVVSGPSAAIDAMAADGVPAKRLAVSHAFHSPQMDAVLADFRATAGTITYGTPALPIAATCDFAGEPHVSAGYWAHQLRHTVTFAPALAALGANHTYVEVGPHPALTPAIGQTLPTATVVPTLRRDRDGRIDLARALARLHVLGHAVDFRTAGAPVPLPTYAFQHGSHWLADRGRMPGTPAHPFLTGSVRVATDATTIHTGLIRPGSHPWLADHAVAGTAILPAAGFVDLVLAAASSSATPALLELILHAPLVVGQEAVELQVVVGDRNVTVHSRPAGDGPWTHHGTGVLTEAAPAAGYDGGPAPDAEEIDGAAVYEALASRGYQYGPAFRGLRRVWLAGTEIHADVELPAGTPATGHAVHPALLDAALHCLAPHAVTRDHPELLLPHTFEGVTLHGPVPSAVRVHATATDHTAIRLEITDPVGRPILTVDRLALAPVAALGPSRALHRVEWHPVDLPTNAGASSETVLIGSRMTGAPTYPDLDSFLADTRPAPAHAVLSLPPMADTPASAHELAAFTLTALQTWLASPRSAETHLTVHADHSGVATAAVWGLVRTAQNEHPGHFSLLTSDATRVPVHLLGKYPEALDRAGVTHVPRLMPVPAGDTGPVWDTTGTVLITGGTGTLGALAARHLVTVHGARYLLLLSRRGMAAPGAREVRDELTALGAEVTVAACDASDREAVAALLDGVDRPVSAVIHAAGVLADAPVHTMTPEQLHTVLTPKIDAAWTLHLLTKDVRTFVLYSSASAALGTPGQGNYAAANAFLDALATLRHQDGLAATSIAWGMWAESSGMTSGLTDADRQRVTDTGLVPITSATGLALLDRAVVAGPSVLASPLNFAALRGPRANALLRTLVATPAAPVVAAPAGLAERVAAAVPAERSAIVLAAVRAIAAEVLAHPDAASIPVDTGFFNLGFDSLGVVDLRNRLNQATGLALPTTVALDHPTPQAMAAYLVERLAPSLESVLVAEMDRLDAVVAGLSLTDDAIRGQAVDRLRDLLRKLGVDDTPAVVLPGGLTDATSADDLLAFIDSEFSSPTPAAEQNRSAP
ncbi:type I polyketide synthase, partial [Micromonospora sp. NIE79]